MNKTQATLKRKNKRASLPAPVLDDIQGALQAPARLRHALNMLQGEMPIEWHTSSITDALNTLREKLERLELQEIRRSGPYEYLLIRPLAPDTGGTVAEKAAEHVRALDDLGLVVRFDT